LAIKAVSWDSSPFMLGNQPPGSSRSRARLRPGLTGEALALKLQASFGTVKNPERGRSNSSKSFRPEFQHRWGIAEPHNVRGIGKEKNRSTSRRFVLFLSFVGGS
jgi:ribosome-binding protein aMBF1 (putative translation factor)